MLANWLFEAYSLRSFLLLSTIPHFTTLQKFTDRISNSLLEKIISSFIVIRIRRGKKKKTGRPRMDDRKAMDDVITKAPLGANIHDMKMSKATLQSIVICRSEPTIRSKQHMCLDRSYDFPEVYELLEEYGYTIHIPLRGEKRRRSSEVIPGYRARHWVVERTHSWTNRCRRLLIRWEKKVENHIAMLHYACAWITYRRAGVFG